MQELFQQELLGPSGLLQDSLIEDIEAVGGGSIDQCWRLKLIDGRQFFAKTGTKTALPRLQCEVKALQALKRFADQTLLLIPEPIGIQELSQASVLLLPWLDLGIGNQKKLGQGLALLHKTSAAKNLGTFGWGSDGYIGLGSQPEGWGNNWGEYFIKFRLLPQLKVATKWGIDLSDWTNFLGSLTSFINTHEPSPCLVHGDLWSGNVGVLNNGKGVLIDPATFWGDREVDIAMTRLFGGFSKDFYEGYQSVWPLESDAMTRVDAYNLYHLLNHANLFGGSYKIQCISMLRELNRLIK